jgi:hypothetical protein
MPKIIRVTSLLPLLLCAACFHFDRQLAPGQLTGKAVVLDAQGKTVSASGATVVLEGSALSVTADSRGVFSITGLPAGTFAIDVSSSIADVGKVGLRLQGISIPANDGLDLGQIELGALGAIQGTVTLGGEPAPEGGVAAIAGVQHTAVTGGTFLLPTLLPGDYALSVLVPDDPGALVSPSTIVHVSPGKTASTSVTFMQTDVATAGAVQGTATAAGAATGSGIDIQFSGGGPDLSSSTSGNYSSGGVPVGIYTVTASLGGFVGVTIPSVIVGNGTTSVPGIVLFADGTAGLDAGTDAGFFCALDSDCPAGLVCVAQACVVPTDAGPQDAGPQDAGPQDAGPQDAGPQDAGPQDAGPQDAGPQDAGPQDAGPQDAGPQDAGPQDAGEGVPVISGLTTNAAMYSEVDGFNQVVLTFNVVQSDSTATATLNGIAMQCGTYQATQPNFTCSYTVTGEDGSGEKPISVTVTDSQGQSTTGTSVVLDVTPVELSVTITPNPSNGAAPPTTQVTASKPLSAAPTVTVTPQGEIHGSVEPGDVSGSGSSWTFPLQLEAPVAGSFSVSVSGADALGHTATQAATFQVNTLDPVELNFKVNGAFFSAVDGFNQVVVTFDYVDVLDMGAVTLSAVLGGFTKDGSPLVMTCSAFQPSSPNYTCTYQVLGNELSADGVTPIANLPNATLSLTVSAVDSVGNEGSTDTVVTFDFTPPALIAAPSLVYIPPPNMYTTGGLDACTGFQNPLSTVSAATTCTDIEVSLTVSEALGSPPTMSTADGTLVFSLSDSSQQSYYFDGVVTTPGKPPDGTGYGLVITAIDLVGNTGFLTPEGPTLTIDTTPPVIPATTPGGPVTYTRVPWGSVATGGTAVSSITGATGAGEPGGTVFALDGLQGNTIGQAPVGADGSFGPVSLSGGDRPVVWLTQADEAGNPSPVTTVHNVTWTASFNGKTPGNTKVNPHVVLAAGASSVTPSVGGPLQAGGTAFGVENPSAAVAPEITSYSGFASTDSTPSTTVAASSWTGPVGSSATPGYLEDPGMAYDSARGVTVLFGGYGNTDVVGNTWEWNGSFWVQRSPLNSPSARSDMAMAYDPARGVTVLFGGYEDSGLDNDTWIWDGNNWTQLFPANSPPARDDGTMVFDTKRGVMVLFGGADNNDGAYNDTWEWDGTNWSQIPLSDTTPSARYGAVMAYDAAHQVSVLFGGQDPSGPNLNDTWLWNGTSWLQVNVDSEVTPQSRSYATMDFDAARGVSVMYGGYCGEGYCSDTWEWDGSSWNVLMESGGPGSGLSYHAMAYDLVHSVSVVYGGDGTGQNYTTDAWFWNGSFWTEAQPVAPGMVVTCGDCGAARKVRPKERRTARQTSSKRLEDLTLTYRQSTALAYDAARGVTVLFGGMDSSSNNLYDTWAWNGNTWTQLNPNGSPQGRASHAMSYDSARAVTVLFGGYSAGTDGSGYLNDTYEWDGSNWTERYSDSTPDVRTSMGLTYDAARAVTLLFGGYSVDHPLNDTWEWNGSGWNQQFPDRSPSPRYAFAMSYDAARGVTVLFGGIDQSGSTLGETWEWNGTNWAQPTPTTAPPARSGCSLVWDTARGTTLLYGGSDATGNYLTDAWLWNGTVWTQLPSINAPAQQNGPVMVYDIARSEAVLLNEVSPNETWLLPSGTSTFPANIAQFDLGATGESLPSISVAQLSLSLQAGGTGYSSPATFASGTSAPGAVVAAWDPAQLGAWRVLSTSTGDSSTPSSFSYTTATPAEASSYVLGGPWQTIDFSVFPAQANGNGPAAGQLSVLDPELTVQYERTESPCTDLNEKCTQCASDETLCGTVCADTQIDPLNCGGCAATGDGAVCEGGTWCINGSCTCPGTEQMCEGACTDENSDPNNCGGCGSDDPGYICNASSTCVNGNCVPTTGCTAASCVDGAVCNPVTGQCAQCATNSDCACVAGVTNPTACSTVATPYCNATGLCVQCLNDGDCANGTCVNGSCQGCPDAGSLTVACAGSCTDTSSDRNNCGGCGVACPPDQGCSGGRCFAP